MFYAFLSQQCVHIYAQIPNTLIFKYYITHCKMLIESCEIVRSAGRSGFSNVSKDRFRHVATRSTCVSHGEFKARGTLASW